MFLKWLGRALGAVAVLGGIALGLIYHLQEHLLYLPRLPDLPKEYAEFPHSYGLEAEDVELETPGKTKDGKLRLHAWFIHGPERASPEMSGAVRPVLLFFQANAGNISHRLHNARQLVSALQCPMMLLSYRGYGASEGKPSEYGLREDATTALHYLSYVRPEEMRKKGKPLEYDAENGIVLFGRSLGGAVALHLAADDKAAAESAGRPPAVAALIVENTFSSIEAMVPCVLPALGLLLGPGRPLNCLLRSRWRNTDAIERRPPGQPLLMLSSSRDELVPAEHMRALRDACPAGEPVMWAEFHRSHHMDAYVAEPAAYFGALKAFWLEHVINRGACVADE